MHIRATKKRTKICVDSVGIELAASCSMTKRGRCSTFAPSAHVFEAVRKRPTFFLISLVSLLDAFVRLGACTSTRTLPGTVPPSVRGEVKVFLGTVVKARPNWRGAKVRLSSQMALQRRIQFEYDDNKKTAALAPKYINDFDGPMWRQLTLSMPLSHGIYIDFVLLSSELLYLPQGDGHGHGCYRGHA